MYATPYPTWIRALPLRWQHTCKSLDEIHWVLEVQSTLNRGNQWCKRSPKLFHKPLVFGFLCLRRPVWSCLLGEVGMLLAWCIGIYDVLVRKRHPITIPKPTNHLVSLQTGSLKSFIVSLEDWLNTHTIHARFARPASWSQRPPWPFLTRPPCFTVKAMLKRKWISLTST